MENNLRLGAALKRISGPAAALGGVALLLVGREALAMVDPPGPGGPTTGLALHRLAAALPLVAFLLYAVLQAAASVRAARREPRVALLVLGLAALALAVRFLVTPRVPMVGQTADLVHLKGALEWLFGTAAWAPGSSAPAYTALLQATLRLFGASFEVAFALTTTLGALLVLPVFAAGRRVGGSTQAGALAGLAAACLPLSVFFSNGVNLETPMAFFLAAVLQHALAFLDDERPSDALRLGLALLLFAQLRQEAVLQVPVILAGLAALLLSSGKALHLVRAPALWASALLAGLLGLPFLALTVGAVPPEHAREVDRALRLLLFVVPAVLLLGPLGRRLQALLRARGILWTRAALGLAALGLLLALKVVWSDGVISLAPQWPSSLPLTPGWITAPVFDATYGSPRTTSLDNPWMVPVTWLVPACLGLLAARRASASRAAPAAGLVLAALTLFWYRLATTCMAKSGELIADGNRYLVPTSGLLALLVGLGTANLLALLPDRPRWRALAVGLAALWMLSPLVTHGRILTDLSFDQQLRYLFVRQAFADLPPRSLVLCPDHAIYAESPGTPHGGEAWQSSRTPALCGAFGLVFGEPEHCEGLRRWAASARAWPGEIVLFLDVDCYRTRTGVEDPLCAELRELPGLVTLDRTVFPNRPYGRYPLSDAPEVEIAVLGVPPDLVDDVRRLVLRAP